MSERRKRIKRKIFILGALLVVIGACFAVYFIYIYQFNHTKRIYTEGASGDLTFAIQPRGGTTDAWTKWIKDGSGEETLYNALIYDATLTNRTDCNVSGWELKINFDGFCYINNAWCGKLEFHQNSGKEPKVQTVDLRNYDINEITLNHLMADTDLLIPMEAGDYFIYKPDAAVKEFPLYASDLAKEEYRDVTIGMIFYYLGEEPLEFSHYEITYYLEKQFWQEPTFWWFTVAGAAWVIAVIIFVIVEISMNAAYRRFLHDEEIIKQSVNVFTTFFDAKDEYTHGHSQRVAECAKKLAQKMRFSEEECRKVYYIALMHDCGKCYIPDSILKKPDRLTLEEYEIIKTHTVKGAEMLKNFDAVEDIREGALYHHERYDGKGYPTGKKGEDIPLIGRIICVADAFDAMNSKRCYRDKLSQERVISELKENRGKQFDPYIVDCMLELIEQGEISMELL